MSEKPNKSSRDREKKRPRLTEEMVQSRMNQVDENVEKNRRERMQRKADAVKQRPPVFGTEWQHNQEAEQTISLSEQAADQVENSLGKKIAIAFGREAAVFLTTLIVAQLDLPSDSHLTIGFFANVLAYAAANNLIDKGRYQDPNNEFKENVIHFGLSSAVGVILAWEIVSGGEFSRSLMNPTQEGRDAAETAVKVAMTGAGLLLGGKGAMKVAPAVGRGIDTVYNAPGKALNKTKELGRSTKETLKRGRKATIDAVINAGMTGVRFVADLPRAGAEKLFDLGVDGINWGLRGIDNQKQKIDKGFDNVSAWFWKKIESTAAQRKNEIFNKRPELNRDSKPIQENPFERRNSFNQGNPFEQRDRFSQTGPFSRPSNPPNSIFNQPPSGDGSFGSWQNKPKPTDELPRNRQDQSRGSSGFPTSNDTTNIFNRPPSSDSVFGKSKDQAKPADQQSQNQQEKQRRLDKQPQKAKPNKPGNRSNK